MLITHQEREILTLQAEPYNNIPTNRRGGYVMYGRVRCARRGCARERRVNQPVCQHCGHVPVFIDIKHKGTRYRISRDVDGRRFFDVQAAHDLHAELRRIYNLDPENFNPRDYTPKAIQERKLGYQADLWLRQKREECEAGELSWGTYESYYTYVKKHFESLEDLDARKIDYRILENFKDALPRTLRIKTKRNIMNALHAMFRYMHRRGVVKDMPAWPEVEGNDSESRAALTYEQQQEGLSRVPLREDREILEFGMDMLLRPGETCALQVRDVDELHRRVRICRTWSRGRLRENTKGRNKIWLPLTSRAWEIIVSRLADKAPDEFIFTNPRTGGAYRPKVLNRLWRAYSGYDLDHYSASRHSGCTQLVHDGTPHLEAQALMRHADIRSTLHYFHPDSDRMRGRLEKRGRANTLQTLKSKRKAAK